MVCVEGLLDHEAASVYQLVVVGRDHGRERLSAETIVVIRVHDMNDNAPKITIRTLTNNDLLASLHLSTAHQPPAIAQVYPTTALALHVIPSPPSVRPSVRPSVSTLNRVNFDLDLLHVCGP